MIVQVQTSSHSAHILTASDILDFEANSLRNTTGTRHGRFFFTRYEGTLIPQYIIIYINIRTYMIIWFPRDCILLQLFVVWICSNLVAGMLKPVPLPALPLISARRSHKCKCDET